MDWIDPRYSSVAEERAPAGRRAKKQKNRKSVKSRKSKRGAAGNAKPLALQVQAALSQPLDVWTAAFDHSLARINWPAGVKRVETTFLWSVVMQEQAEALVRAGMSAKKLAAIVAESTAVTDADKAAQLVHVVGLMDQPLDAIAFHWLESGDAYAQSALGLLGLAWHIPDHGRRAGNTWLTQWLQAAMDRVASFEPAPETSILCRLAFQCELPLLVGLATSASKKTILVESTRAMDFVAEFLEASESDSAPWLMYGATYLRAALASVLRCRVLADTLGLRGWYPAQQKALSGLLKHAARWSRQDGTHLLGAGHGIQNSKSIWAALADQTKRSKTLTSVMTLSGIGERGRREVARTVNAAKLPALTHNSSGARCVSMQADWRDKGSRIAIDFSETDICIEALGPAGNSLLAGDWTARVELNGQAELQLDEWEEVCWFSDDDVDYLELEAQFGQHARVQRQISLFREERLLFLADTLLGDLEGDWQLRAEIPLAPECKYKSATKTTEGFIQVGKARCLTLPLFLPEWRRQLSLASSASSFEFENGQLVTSAKTETQRLYTACCINLLTSNKREQFTWRNLTVADELRIVGSDEAVAHRVQIGQQQLVIYRSLAPATRRTALGMHTMADFYVGRFDADDGELDTVVEVEAT